MNVVIPERVATVVARTLAAAVCAFEVPAVVVVIQAVLGKFFRPVHGLHSQRRHDPSCRTVNAADSAFATGSNGENPNGDQPS